MEERFIDQTLDAHAGGLLYLQLESVLKQRMQGGDYAVGDRIPTEPELCEEFGVSRITVRRAIQDPQEDSRPWNVRGRSQVRGWNWNQLRPWLWRAESRGHAYAL